MLGFLDNDKALSRLTEYFNVLKQTGYVNTGVMNRYAVYLFLLDFVENLYIYLDDCEYATIDKVLRSLFNGSSCLLSYELFSKHRTQVGKPYFMGGSYLRSTEVDKDLRITEDTIQRKV